MSTLRDHRCRKATSNPLWKVFCRDNPDSTHIVLVWALYFLLLENQHAFADWQSAYLSYNLLQLLIAMCLTNCKLSVERLGNRQWNLFTKCGALTERFHYFRCILRSRVWRLMVLEVCCLNCDKCLRWPSCVPLAISIGNTGLQFFWCTYFVRCQNKRKVVDMRWKSLRVLLSTARSSWRRNTFNTFASWWTNMLPESKVYTKVLLRHFDQFLSIDLFIIVAVYFKCTPSKKWNLCAP